MASEPHVGGQEEVVGGAARNDARCEAGLV